MRARLMRSVRVAARVAAAGLAGRSAPSLAADWIVAGGKGAGSFHLLQGAWGAGLAAVRPGAGVPFAERRFQALGQAAAAMAPLITPARALTIPPAQGKLQASRRIGRAAPSAGLVGSGGRALTLLPDDGIAGIKQRFKMIMQEYGKVALLSHITIWGGSTALVYVALESMGMESIMSHLPESISSHIDAKAGALAVAVVLTKLTGPLRLLIDIAITPTLAGYLRNTWLAGPLGLRKTSDMGGSGGRYRDSYRVVGQLARPYAADGRLRARMLANKYYERAKTGYQAGKTRANTTAGRVLIWAGDIRNRRSRVRRGGGPHPPNGPGPQDRQQSKRSMF